MRDIRILPVLNLLTDNEGEISKKKGANISLYSVFGQTIRSIMRDNGLEDSSVCSLLNKFTVFT